SHSHPGTQRTPTFAPLELLAVTKNSVRYDFPENQRVGDNFFRFGTIVFQANVKALKLRF
ncbi:MAG: hypothetical protein Q3963_07975, partial [Coriobacteriaceae bacterium]|nr:hypothetical protein [Coriobacteriaceae bacterium]